MSFKPTNEQLVDFVYGNLPEAERLQVKETIKQHSKVKQQVENLKASLSFLHNLPDEEVLEPKDFVWGMTKKSANTNSLWPILAVAASLSLLLIVGYVTKFELKYGSFELTFDRAPRIEQKGLTNNQVQAMINQSIESNRIEFMAQLKNLKSDFNTQLVANSTLQLKQMKRVAANYKELPKKQVQAYLAQLNKTNRAMVHDFFTASATEQRDYMNSILTDYFEYMDKKREEDFLVLKASIEDVDYKSHKRIEQTDQILSTILASVNPASMEQ